MSHNTLINGYWAQCIRCHKVHAEKLFPRSKTEPWLPGLWCKRCQTKIDHPPKPKVKKQKVRQPVKTPTVAPAPSKILLRCRSLKDNVGSRWFVFTGHGSDRRFLGSGQSREEAIKAAKAGMFYISSPERSGDEPATNTEFTIEFPASEGRPAPIGMSQEFKDKLTRALLTPKKVNKPYVIPPSSTDPSKPRTRTEFNEEFGGFEFYLRDKLVGIGKTEKEAMDDSVRRKGEPYSLMPDLKAAVGIESHDHPDPASSGDVEEDSQSALRPNCALSRLEVGGVQEHADSEEAAVTSLPANWQMVQDPTGRWVVNKVSADGKYSTPIGFGRTREAAIANAHTTVQRAANLLAKWNKADPWEKRFGIRPQM